MKFKIGGKNVDDEHKIERCVNVEQKLEEVKQKEKLNKMEKKRLKAEKKERKKREKEEKRRREKEEKEEQAKEEEEKNGAEGIPQPPQPSLKISLRRLACWRGGGFESASPTTPYEHPQNSKEGFLLPLTVLCKLHDCLF